MHIVPFTELQKQIHKVVEESYTMTSTRRMMLRVTEKVAHEIGAHAIVNGENLGQVASQTLGSMYAINSVTSMPILRPLLTFDKEDIVKKRKLLIHLIYQFNHLRIVVRYLHQKSKDKS